MASIKGLFIKGTSKTPEIDFSPGVLNLSGRSIPEDSIAFFQPVIRWLETYLSNPEKFTKVNFQIEYINSGSNRFVFTMLKMLDQSYRNGANITISWHYENDDDTIKGLGQDLQTFLEVPINMVEI